MLWDLVQILMGEASIIDKLTLADCLKKAAHQNYLADGLATFRCEFTLN